MTPLVIEITTAFPLLRVPTRSEIFIGDERSSSLEERRVADFFSGLTWRDVSLDNLRANYIGDPSACLSFMSYRAFRYYLPSFLLICISDFQDADMIYESTIARLTPNVTINFEHSKDIQIEDAVFLSRIERLTQMQRVVITKFLSEMASEHDDQWNSAATIALKRYWFSYVGSSS